MTDEERKAQVALLVQAGHVSREEGERLLESSEDLRARLFKVDAYEQGREDERALIVRWMRGRAIEIATLNSVEASAASVALQTAALRLEDPRPLP